MADLEITAFVRLDGQDVPGFEGGVRLRIPAPASGSFTHLIPAGAAAGPSPAAGLVAVTSALAFVTDKPLIFYPGTDHTEGLPIGPGLIIIAGDAGIAGGLEIAGGADDATLRGVVVGQ